MNVFNKVALQGLKKNRTRTLVTIIGVALSAAMITAVAAFGTSLLHFLVNNSIAEYGGWHAAFPDVDTAFVQAHVQDREVASAATFEDIGYAMLDGAKSADKPYLFIAGFHDKTSDMLPITLISGRLPETDSEILVPSHVAVKGGVRLVRGDTLSLAVGTRQNGGKTLNQHDPYAAGEILVPTGQKVYTVVGTYERPGFEEHAAPGYTLVTKAAATGQAAHVSLFVTLKNPRDAQSYASSIAENYFLNENVLRFLGASENKLFNTLLFSVGGILVAIIMIGSVFLIYNSFNISLNERTHQFGVLMSVGATAKQLRYSVLFEGLCIGAIGIPLGVLAGIGSIGLVLPVVADKFSTILASRASALTLSVSAPALVAAAAVSLVTILISAYIPARKAAATPVMDCIRQTNEVKLESKSLKISALAQRVYGLEGTLALKNFKRNKGRYRSIVLSLVLSVVLFVTGSAFGSTLKQFAKEKAVEADGDVAFYTQAMEETELFRLYDKLKETGGVTRSTYQADLTYPCTTDAFPSDFLSAYRASTGEKNTGNTVALPLHVQFIEDTIYYDFVQSLGLPPAEYAGKDAKLLIIGMNAVEHVTYFTNSTMAFTLSTTAGEKTIRATFVDSYPLDPLPEDTAEPASDYRFMVVAPWQLKAQFAAPNTPTSLGLTFWSDDPAQSLVQMQSSLDELSVSADYTLLNLSTAFQLFRSLTFVVDVFTYVFVVMISLIAVANVFNTISTNIKLRRRELAMLRSVGMSERGFNRMMNFECAFYGIRTLLYGVPLAGLLSWLIYRVIAYEEELEHFTFAFPWGSMMISVLGVFLIVFITMVYATSRIKKENIIDALRDEIT